MEAEGIDAYGPPARPLYAVHASDGRVSPAARAFLEIAKRHLERLGWQAAFRRPIPGGVRRDRVNNSS
jgi:hypothetical protein